MNSLNLKLSRQLLFLFNLFNSYRVLKAVKAIQLQNAIFLVCRIVIKVNTALVEPWVGLRLEPLAGWRQVHGA